MLPTNGQVRVIDPILTSVARGYKNGKFVGYSLFPRVPVKQRGGKIIAFGKEHFRLYNTVRTPGATTVLIESKYGSQDYTLVQHAISEPVPFEHLEEANQVPGIDLGGRAVARVQAIIALSTEYDQARLARDANNYASTNKVTLSGDSKWSDPDSDPIKDVEAYKDVVRQRIGIDPNTLTVSGSVFAALKTHPKIVDRLKYTGREVATAEIIASLFDLQKVEVGKAVYLDASDVMQSVWGNDAVLAFTEIGSMDAEVPSYGYTYELENHPFVEEPYQDRRSSSWIYTIVDELKPVIAGADAGFLIKDAV